MAKLYFIYSAMDSGKSSELIQNAHNYTARGMRPFVLKPDIDTRDGTEPAVKSRTGLTWPAFVIKVGDLESLCNVLESAVDLAADIVFVDEVQFFSVEQIKLLEDLVDKYDIPVMCYGLRNSFDNKGFPAADWLLRNADKLVEVKNICYCGAKATHNLMVVNGAPVRCLETTVNIGGNELYHAVCRKHFKSGNHI